MEKNIIYASDLKNAITRLLICSTYIRLKGGQKHMDTLRSLMAKRVKGSYRLILKNIPKM